MSEPLYRVFTEVDKDVVILEEENITYVEAKSFCIAHNCQIAGRNPEKKVYQFEIMPTYAVR